ncbi:hypothetical protein, partial [Chthonomonas calidirosea]|uniref:hypothetical protein n=1 Tax=Chthonomonas calidirosea TaxID=454171 RepID=UPI0006ECA5F3
EIIATLSVPPRKTFYSMPVHHKISRNEAVGSVQNCTIPVHVSVETVDVQKGCDKILLQGANDVI